MSNLQTITREMLWSLWTELGVPGGGRKHQNILLDPEPLIVNTPHLAADDNRLLGLAFDWCVAHSDLLSKSRIAALARVSTTEIQKSLGAFNSALASYGVNWFPKGESQLLQTSRMTMALPLDRPALLRLRMRTLVGVSARAEVLTTLMSADHRQLTIEELTAPGISRRSVERVISDLVLGNFLAVNGNKRGRRFSLRGQEGLSVLPGYDSESRIPTVINWHLVLSATTLITALQASDSQSAGLRSVEAVKARKTLAEILRTLHHPEPPNLSGQNDPFKKLVEWGTSLVGDWANGRFRL